MYPIAYFQIATGFRNFFLIFPFLKCVPKNSVKFPVSEIQKRTRVKFIKLTLFGEAFAYILYIFKVFVINPIVHIKRYPPIALNSHQYFIPFWVISYYFKYIQRLVSKPYVSCWAGIGTQPFLGAWVYLHIYSQSLNLNDIITGYASITKPKRYYRHFATFDSDNSLVWKHTCLCNRH